MPRNGLYGAGGKTWRHISQSGRVPPDWRLAPQHHECPLRVISGHWPKPLNAVARSAVLPNFPLKFFQQKICEEVSGISPPTRSHEAGGLRFFPQSRSKGHGRRRSKSPARITKPSNAPRENCLCMYRSLKLTMGRHRWLPVDDKPVVAKLRYTERLPPCPEAHFQDIS